MINFNLTASNTVELLNRNTSAGLFICANGPVFWILPDHQGRKFAVQLNETVGRPAFSYYSLGASPAGVGIFLGKVQFSVSLDVPSPGSFYGLGGILIRSGRRMYLKANHPCGQSQRLLVKPYLFRDHVNSAFYPRWKLVIRKEGTRVVVFESSAGPSRLRRYEAQETGGLFDSSVLPQQRPYQDGIDRR